MLDGLELKPTNDLRTTKALFVKAYIAKLTQQEEEDQNSGNNSMQLLTNAQKHKLGVQTWMNSSLRAVLMGGKYGKGVAAVNAAIRRL